MAFMDLIRKNVFKSLLPSCLTSTIAKMCDTFVTEKRYVTAVTGTRPTARGGTTERGAGPPRMGEGTASEGWVPKTQPSHHPEWGPMTSRVIHPLNREWILNRGTARWGTFATVIYPLVLVGFRQCFCIKRFCSGWLSLISGVRLGSRVLSTSAGLLGPGSRDGRSRILVRDLCVKLNY